MQGLHVGMPAYMHFFSLTASHCRQRLQVTLAQNDMPDLALEKELTFQFRQTFHFSPTTFEMTDFQQKGQILSTNSASKFKQFHHF